MSFQVFPLHGCRRGAPLARGSRARRILPHLRRPPLWLGAWCISRDAPFLLLVAGCLSGTVLLPGPAALAEPGGNATPPASKTRKPAATPRSPYSTANPNQPYAIDKPELLPPPCPLIVSPDLPALQPIRIQPSQVAAKNRMGCLSAADAIYGPDGCPIKLCPPTSGAFPAAKPR